MNSRWRVTVMLGGPSAEREVSLRSGAAVTKALRELGHEVTELDPREDGWSIPAGTELVFLALHGTYGEDGTVQERLERLGIPFTGSDSASSRRAFDKLETKKRCVMAGVATPRFCVVDSPSAGWPVGWYPPVVMKPVRQGSSVGLHLIEEADQWRGALTEALRHDGQVLVEERVPGREVTVGIMGQRALPVVEIVPRGGAFDYQSKYSSGQTQYHCPARLDQAARDRVQSAALAAFRAVECRDYARVDAIVRPEGVPVILEINTLPGMTESSLLPLAAGVAGYTFPELCQQMLEMAMRRVKLKLR